MTEQEAYESFCRHTMEITGCTTDRYTFNRVLNTHRRALGITNEEVCAALRRSYGNAVYYFTESVNWQELANVTSREFPEVIWAVFLRKAHDEEKERSE